MLSTIQLPVAQIVSATEAEGPGRRFAIWLQGCPLRCPGCCNPEMLPFDGGTMTGVESLVEQVEQAAVEHGIEGITLLGGEPTAHAAGSACLAQEVQRLGLSVMVFSGFTLAEIREMAEPAVDLLLRHTDILVDGPYLREQPDTSRRWIGSKNQRIHFLSDHYRADDPRWRAANTLEIRMTAGEITVNGFPALDAAGIWKRPAVRDRLK